MNIRKAVPDDALEIARVHVDSWRAAYRGLLPDDRLARLDPTLCAERFREAITHEAEQIYIVENITGIVGFMGLGPSRDVGKEDDAGEIYALYLTPEHWRTGTGRRMMETAEIVIRTLGCSRVVLWTFKANSRARMFYEAMGFLTDGATKTMDIGAPVDCLKYWKIIGL